MHHIDVPVHSFILKGSPVTDYNSLRIATTSPCPDSSLIPLENLHSSLCIVFTSTALIYLWCRCSCQINFLHLRVIQYIMDSCAVFMSMQVDFSWFVSASRSDSFLWCYSSLLCAWNIMLEISFHLSFTLSNSCSLANFDGIKSCLIIENIYTGKISWNCSNFNKLFAVFLCSLYLLKRYTSQRLIWIKGNCPPPWIFSGCVA